VCVGGWVVVLRDHNSLFLGAFAQNLNTNSAFNAEVLGAITAIDIATEKNWTNLWLETDSKHVTLAFKNKEMVPWSLGNRWLNCLDDIKQMNFLISHVYREGNSCADSLANVGLALSLFVWFPSLPELRAISVASFFGDQGYLISVWLTILFHDWTFNFERKGEKSSKHPFEKI